jgi:hypothetical protein
MIFLLGSRRRAHHQRGNVDDEVPGCVRAEGLGVQQLRSPPLGQGGE